MKIGRQDKKEVITNLLKGYLLKDITLFLNFVIDKVMKNIDIKFALEEDQEEIYKNVKEMFYYIKTIIIMKYLMLKSKCVNI